MAKKAPFAPHRRVNRLHEAQLAIADQMMDFAGSGYGPRGGSKLVVNADSQVLRDSPASAMREIEFADALVRPYKNLASSVQAQVGDGGTTAVLLAARLVHNALSNPAVSIGTMLDGYELARRQAMAVLGATAKRQAPEQLLAGLGAPDHIATVLSGLAQLGSDLHGHLDLDRVDIRCEGTDAAWLEGVVMDAKAAPPERRINNAGVLLLTHDAVPKVEGGATQVRSATGLQAAREAERAAHVRSIEEIERLGARIVVSGKTIPDDVAHDLARAGIITSDNCTEDGLIRLANATGAQIVPRPRDATLDSIGKADAVRRHHRLGGWLVSGPGPSATLCVPAAGLDANAIDAAERLLRAAGPVLADARGLPGGGRWQRAVATSLRKAAPMAPGKQALAVEMAAEAFTFQVDCLVRNQGLRPLDAPNLPDAPGEPSAAVEFAVTAAFEVARQLLRLDARIDKLPSTPAQLRGGLGPSGSPKGMPGDIPPLM